MPVLLVPAVRSPAHPSLPRPRSPPLKPVPTKLVRARSGSTSHSVPNPDAQPFTPPTYAEECLGIPLDFVALPDLIQVEGYQMYAVEKWVVDRRPIPVLLVYTGDASHKITVTAFKPSPTLPQDKVQAQWDKAIHHLRADGARPKQTPHGTLMVTSLAHFRSDYTIVYVPNGNYLAAREQLYTNINLLRTGCSGRSALTLEEPSDTTKDRFISTYHLPDTTDLPASHFPTSTDSLPLSPTHPITPNPSPSSKPRPKHSSTRSTDFDLATLDASKTGSFSKAAAGLGLGLPSALNHGSPTSSNKVSGKTRDRATFNATVLELVKLIQAGLSIFGLYGSVTRGDVILDGLLCDQTVEGMSQWIGQFGEHLLGLEPMERIADPTLVSSLLSTVLSIRNKLSIIGYNHVLPKDPFLHPYGLSLVLAAYNQATISGHAHGIISSASNTLYHQTTLYSPHASGYTSTGGLASASSSISGAPNSAHPIHGTSFQIGLTLSRDLFLSIASTYDGKTKLGEGRKVRKVIREKLDDLTSAVASGVGASAADDDEDLRAYPSSVPTSSHGATGTGGGLGGVEAEGSAGPILSGIGSIASGLGLVGGSTSGVTTANIMDTITDLATFARIVVKDAANTRQGRGIGVGKGKAKARDKRESIDGFGSIGYGYPGKERERDIVAASVAGSVKALWSGRVWSIIRLREWEAERDRELTGNVHDRRSVDRDASRPAGVVSDGDVEVDLDRGRYEKLDGRSTEEESDLVLPGTGFWGDRVQRRLAWTGLTRLDGKVNRKKGGASLDLSAPSTAKGSIFSISIPKLPDIPPTPSVVAPQSPTLVATNSLTGDSRFDDDDLPSSGQVSPVAEGRTNRFAFFHEGHSGYGSATGSSLVQSYADFERRALDFDPRQPWKFRPIQNRISSWSDTRSAWRNETRESGDDFETAAEDVNVGKSEGGSESIGTGKAIDQSEGSGSKKGVSMDTDMIGYMPRAKGLFITPKRRRSFHDLESFRDVYVLRAEQMRVDVDICGQLLVMMRRDEHLRNVTAAVELIVNSLSKTNTALRDNYEKHAPYLTNPGIHTSVINDINSLYNEANKASQITNTLLYESEQFRIGDLWQTASPSRHKVLEVRDKVFGGGGRRLPQGVRGAHGKFNRLQWTLDGKKRLVDKYGRTESEAEHEDRCINGVNLYGTGAERRGGSSFMKERTEDEGDFVDRVTVPVQKEQVLAKQNGAGKTEKGGVSVMDRRTDEEEVDAVPHARIKPLWLLKVFTRWGGGVWGGAAGGGNAGGIDAKGGPGSSSSPASPTATAITSAVAPAVDAASAVVASTAAIATVAVADLVSAASAATTFKGNSGEPSSGDSN